VSSSQLCSFMGLSRKVKRVGFGLRSSGSQSRAYWVHSLSPCNSTFAKWFCF
jgi:hypothetical protein